MLCLLLIGQSRHEQRRGAALKKREGGSLDILEHVLLAIGTDKYLGMARCVLEDIRLEIKNAMLSGGSRVTDGIRARGRTITKIF